MKSGPGRTKESGRLRAGHVQVFLRRTVLEQLDWYIKNGPNHGYYGSRKQFDARHQEITAWIKRELEVTKKATR